MKIAYVSTLRSSAWGGSEELWFQSAEEAVKQQHQLGIFVYDWPDEPAKLTRLREAGASIYRRDKMPPLWKRVVTKLSKGITGKAPGWLHPYKALKKFQPDLIIVTDGSTYYTADDSALSGLLLGSFRSRYAIISQNNSDYHLPSDRKHAIELFENARRVFFVSDNNRQMAYRQLAFRLTRADLIQNPLLLDRLDGIPFPAMDGIIHCALVGRFAISDKGQDILLAVLNEERWRSAPIRFHLYGKGQDKAYLESLIAFYGLSDKVVMEGYTENREEIWNKCHCLLMCSHTEGTPLTLLEAMMAGRVCIVTRVGGNEEWIEDGVNGFLVEAPAKRIFSARLEEAFARLEEWPSIGAAAHELARKQILPNPGKALLETLTMNKNS